MPDASLATLNASYKEKFGFSVANTAIVQSKPGLTEATVRELSATKGEPAWMLEQRLKALEVFQEKPMPSWGADLTGINFDALTYYLKPSDAVALSWDDVPAGVKTTFDRLGIPQAERAFLAGVGAQFDSEAVYHSLRADLQKQGVIFTDLDTALQEYPDLVKEYIGTLVPMTDNKFAALNSAAWSGGSFVYVPKCVNVTIPLQAYFRINAERLGQFERTLIVVDEGANVHYIEGCTAPSYTTNSLHAAVVEVFAKKGAHVRYTTIQNWSSHVYNLVTKRAIAHEEATVEWVDGNLGSQVTMKYPCVILKGRGSRADVLGLALAGPGQHQDTGAKIIHIAPDTTSTVLQKSISHGGGRASFRGLLKVVKQAERVTASTRCDALLLDGDSRSDTWPHLELYANDVTLSHEASVGRVSDDQLFYLRSRGISESDAYAMIVNGFIEPIVKELPLEYAAELNRLIQLEMEGSVG